jgi:hypothetical protein
MEHEKIYLDKKAKIDSQSPKTIGNFPCSKKKYTLGGQRGENKPKNGIRGPKSIWSCVISIDREFYME